MIDLLIENWLKKKDNNYTQRQYKSSITSFRTFVRKEVDLDLFDDLNAIQICAQIWVSLSHKQDSISLSTIKSRISIISAFYEFAILSQATKINPIQNIGKSINQSTSSDLTSLNRETLEGKRNFALILIARETCKPFSQLANIKLSDLLLVEDRYSIHWKKSSTLLTREVSQALSDYLKEASEFLGNQNSKIWISFSNRNKYSAISQKTVANICTGKLDKCQNSLEFSDVVQLYRNGCSVQDILKKGVRNGQEYNRFRQIHASPD